MKVQSVATVADSHFKITISPVMKHAVREFDTLYMPEEKEDSACSYNREQHSDSTPTSIRLCGNPRGDGLILSHFPAPGSLSYCKLTILRLT
jgi:hypothetical protein